MNIGDLEGNPKIANISKSKIQPMNESRESVDSSSIINESRDLVNHKEKEPGRKRLSQSKTIDEVTHFEAEKMKAKFGNNMIDKINNSMKRITTE